ncbi:SH3 domain-containing protein [Maliponia aquimaris]|uniref:Bacterial SH3 domain protein n=1 Tax=Maliponia aquimaris TaxID=1673631 RepID=A0A238KV58_9RHOB|nr:SH3 domain-containing protein [Maliponia aquimaris]SMX46685.1 Bacterial SH3 domain protein [Maliponia aquimaris]
MRHILGSVQAGGRDALRRVRGAAWRLGLMGVTFAALGWAWYAMSGGSEFEPGEHGVTILAEVKPAAPVVAPRPAGLTIQPRELAPVVEVEPRVSSLQTRDPLPSKSVRVPERVVEAPAPAAPAPEPLVETPDPETLRDQLGDDFTLAITQAIQDSDVTPPPAESFDIGEPVDPAAETPFIAGLGAAQPLGTPLAEGTPVLAQPDLLSAEPEFRTVTGTRVNLRDGPATSFDVVTQLFEGDEVEVLEDSGDGWVRLRTLNGEQVGWMSDDFLERRN